MFGNYITTLDDIDNWPADIELDAQLEVIQRAEDLIEQLTSDYFYTKAFSLYFDGNDRERLDLGLLPDILSVTQILITEEILDTDLWRYDKDSVYSNPGYYVENPDIPAVLFPKGLRNIQITGTYGWSSCPLAIKKAAVILCRVENDSTLYTQYHDFMSEKLGDASISLGTKMFGRSFLSGITEVDNLIRHCIRKKPMMGMA